MLQLLFSTGYGYGLVVLLLEFLFFACGLEETQQIYDCR